jgi:hypothetical protein
MLSKAVQENHRGQDCWGHGTGFMVGLLIIVCYLSPGELPH